MVEILNVIISLLILLLVSIFPLGVSSYRKKIILNKPLFDKMSLNILFNTYGLFIISFTNISYSIYFFLLILFSILINFTNFIQFTNLISIKIIYKNYEFRDIVFFILINLIIFFNITGDPTLTWDGLENWYFKAQNFFYNYNFFDLNNIRGIDYYPHLGGFLWGFFWQNSYLQYEYFGRFIYIFIFLLSIFSITDLFKNKDFIKPLATVLIIIICYDDFLFRGYQDMLLFSFLIFISKYFYQYLENKKKTDLIICFLYLSLLPWIKNEGYLLVLVFTCSLLIVLKDISKKLVIFIFIILSWILIILKHYLFYKYLSFNPTHGANLDIIFNLDIFLNFLVSIFKGIFIAMFKYKIWLFILFSFFMLIKDNKFMKNEIIFFNFLKINLLLYFLAIMFIYYDFIDDYRGLYWWIHTTLDRLLYSISGFFIITIILIVNLKKIKF